MGNINQIAFFTNLPHNTGITSSTMNISEVNSRMMQLSYFTHNKEKITLAQWYKEIGGLTKIYNILINIIEILKTIHNKGFVYGNLSPSRIYVFKYTNNHSVFLVDNNDLKFKTNLLNNTFVSPYGAPELVNKTAPNTPMSDFHAFSVIAYELLTFNNPLICTNTSENGENEFLTWVDSSSDNANIQYNSLVPDKVMSHKLKGLFSQSFKIGLNSPMLRPTWAEWLGGFKLIQNELLKCGNEHCQMYYPYNNLNKCTFCGHVSKHVLKLKVQRWEEVKCLDKNMEPIYNIQPTIYEEILVDEYTNKHLLAADFLIEGMSPFTQILYFQQFVENNEIKFSLTALIPIVLHFSDKFNPLEKNKTFEMKPRQKLKVYQKDSTNFILHLQNLNKSQRVLNIG